MILRGTVFSKTLGMDTGITVVTPNHRSNGSYKVAYMLHGLCGNHENWLDLSMLANYANVGNTVYVCPEVGRSFYADMKYGLKYFTYITEELPEICEDLFNISAERENTAVIGVSMGGYGALKCALSKPEQYGICCAFAPAFLFLKEYLENTDKGDLEADCKAIFGENMTWNPDDDLLTLAHRCKEEWYPKIYIAVGKEDFLHDQVVRFVNEMHKIKELDCTYEEWKGEHDWFFFNEALKVAVGMFSL